jgi:hypothetical protein
MSMADEYAQAAARSVEAARACFKRCAVGTHVWKPDRVAIFFEDGSAAVVSAAEWTRIRGW